MNTKMNFLANIQYRSVSRNAEQYYIPVEKLSKSIYIQFMFSYKYNPRTMIYMGYSNKSIGNDNIDLQKANQTFFMKLGYALGL
ncbi:MAG: hypothetical protein KKG99_17170 [Bacteroidetes bacterium]|nr:hypothetical protein [Bacteroidota bacterium]